MPSGMYLFTLQTPVPNNHSACRCPITLRNCSIRKRKCHFDKIFITDCTESCQNDNFRCSQWCKFCQNGNICVPVYVALSAKKDDVSWIWWYFKRALCRWWALVGSPGMVSAHRPCIFTQSAGLSRPRPSPCLGDRARHNDKTGPAAHSALSFWENEPTRNIEINGLPTSRLFYNQLVW